MAVKKKAKSLKRKITTKTSKKPVKRLGSRKKLNRVVTIKTKEKKVKAKLPKIKKFDGQTKLQEFSIEEFKFPSLNELNPGDANSKAESKKTSIFDFFKRKKK